MLKTIVVLGIFYLIIIMLAFAFKVKEMPRFFQDMPHRSDWFKIKRVKLNVHYTFKIC